LNGERIQNTPQILQVFAFLKRCSSTNGLITDLLLELHGAYFRCRLPLLYWLLSCQMQQLHEQGVLDLLGLARAGSSDMCLWKGQCCCEHSLFFQHPRSCLYHCSICLSLGCAYVVRLCVLEYRLFYSYFHEPINDKTCSESEDVAIPTVGVSDDVAHSDPVEAEKSMDQVCAPEVWACVDAHGAGLASMLQEASAPLYECLRMRMVTFQGDWGGMLQQFHEVTLSARTTGARDQHGHTVRVGRYLAG
jgi:hypothetical protein